MNPASGEPDVLGKIDALLTRHRTGAPTRQDLASTEAQAARAAIPILTEIIADDRTIPVLTEALPAAEEKKVAASTPASAVCPSTDTSHDDEALRQIEESMVQELENRITLEFTATMARTLIELLDHTREHIRYAVREAVKQRLGTPPHGAQEEPDQP